MSSRYERVLVVLPAFNEEESVARTVESVREAMPGVTCLVVDDSSNDATAAEAANAGARVLRLPFNLGVGGAMRAGFTFARDRGFDIVLQVDADGQHDPSEAESLLAELEHADLVIGARFAGKGEYDVKGPRRWAMVVLAGILSRVTGVRLTDTTSGYRASGPAAVALFARHYPAEYLGDTIETIVIAARTGMRITQVPVSMRPRAGGVPSHNPVKSARYLARAVLALGFALMRPGSSYRPGDRS